MRSDKTRQIAMVLAVVSALGLMWPTLAAATQNSHQFNQSWLVLGPYYRKNTGGNPGNTALRLDYLTDGVITETSIIPTTGAVINTNYSLPQCGSYSFVWRTNANGKDAPTIFRYDLLGDADLVDWRGGVFNQPSDDRLENTMVYAFAFANNLTGANITNARVGVDSDDSIMVLVNGIERYINNTARGVNGTANTAVNVSGTFTLYPGNNLVAVKTYNGGGGFAMRCRLQNASTTGVNQGIGILPSLVIWQTGGSYSYPPPAIPANQATAYRKINSLMNFTPGTPVNVNVVVTTSSGHPANVRVREWPPQGWAIGTPTVSLGTATVETTTTARGTTSIIRWDIGPMVFGTSNTALLSYWMTPPVGATRDTICTGSVITDAQRLISRDNYIYAATQNHTGGMGLFDWYGDVGDPFLGMRLTEASDPSLIPVWFGINAVAILGNGVNTGRSTFDGTNYSITGAGTDIWGTNDHCRLAVKRMTGNFILKADVMWTSHSQQNWSKAALIVCSSIGSGATRLWTGNRNYFQPNWADPDRFTRTQRTYFTQWRDTDWASAGEGGGQIAVTTSTNPAQSPNTSIIPSSFKLVKRGNIIDSFGLYNGQWVRHGGSPHTLPGLTSDTIVAGFLAGSVNRWTSATAQFSNVSFNPLPCVSATRSYSPSVYSTQPVTVRIFLKNGGGTAALTVRDFAPTSWTITGSNPAGVVDDASTITWTLGAFSADTTLTYTVVPPSADYIVPGLWGNGFVNDQTNIISGLPIVGSSVLQRYLVTTFQQGRFPTSSYAGTLDSSIIMWYSGTRNQGWTAEMEEGDNNNGRNDSKMMLVKFDVGLISPAATVYQARLMLYHGRNRTVAGGPNGTSGTVHRIYAARINRPWIEGCATNGTDGRPANLDEVTYYWAKNRTSPWASGGLRGGALDADLPESFADASSFTRTTWVVWDVTRMVDRWVHEPSSNLGVKLAQDDQNTTHYPVLWRGWVPDQWYGRYSFGIFDFNSRNNGTTALRPILAVMAYVPTQLSASHWELYR